jgi:hypothetical protein
VPDANNGSTVGQAERAPCGPADNTTPPEPPEGQLPPEEGGPRPPWWRLLPILIAPAKES